MRIIGCGNRERGDDAAGVLVAERLRELGVESADVEAKTCRGEATEVMDAWGAEDHVIVVDAVVTGASAGTVHRWDGEVPRGNGGTSASTHGLGVGEAIQLAKALGRSPKSLRVYGIEGKQFDRGCEISFEVKRAVESVAQQISAEIRALHGR
jgi:hydrogenase maturation protease